VGRDIYAEFEVNTDAITPADIRVNHAAQTKGVGIVENGALNGRGGRCENEDGNADGKKLFDHG